LLPPNTSLPFFCLLSHSLVNPKISEYLIFALLLVYDGWLCVNLGYFCVLMLTGRDYGLRDCYFVVHAFWAGYWYYLLYVAC
jgi:hypothetical protein